MPLPPWPPFPPPARTGSSVWAEQKPQSQSGLDVLWLQAGAGRKRDGLLLTQPTLAGLVGGRMRAGGQGDGGGDA